MAGESASLLAHKRVMTVRELLISWVPETDAPFEMLKNGLMEAVANGEMDGTDEQPGLFYIDDQSPKFWHTRGKELMGALSANELGAVEALARYIDDGAIAVSREAVLAFCHARNMPPPSWWATTPTPAQPNGKVRNVWAKKAPPQPGKTKRRSGGAPPNVTDAILEWIADKPPEIKGLNNTKMESQFMADRPGIGKVNSIAETIRKLRAAGRMEPVSN